MERLRGNGMLVEFRRIFPCGRQQGARHSNAFELPAENSPERRSRGKQGEFDAGRSSIDCEDQRRYASPVSCRSLSNRLSGLHDLNSSNAFVEGANVIPEMHDGLDSVVFVTENADARGFGIEISCSQ